MSVEVTGQNKHTGLTVIQGGGIDGTIGGEPRSRRCSRPGQAGSFWHPSVCVCACPFVAPAASLCSLIGPQPQPTRFLPEFWPFRGFDIPVLQTIAESSRRFSFSFVPVCTLSALSICLYFIYFMICRVCPLLQTPPSFGARTKTNTGPPITLSGSRPYHAWLEPASLFFFKSFDTGRVHGAETVITTAGTILVLVPE